MRAIPDMPGYLVDEVGGVFSTKLGAVRKRKPVMDRDGYWRVGLMVDGKLRLVGVHRIVCIAFNGPPPVPTDEVRHLDGVKTNNVPANLKWGTRAENAQDMLRHGGHRAQTHPESYRPEKHSAYKAAWWAEHPEAVRRGERNVSAKLTDASVQTIRARLASGEKHRVIAADYGVSRSAITLIASGKNWAHAKDHKEQST